MAEVSKAIKMTNE